MILLIHHAFCGLSILQCVVPMYSCDIWCVQAPGHPKVTTQIMFPFVHHFFCHVLLYRKNHLCLLHYLFIMDCYLPLPHENIVWFPLSSVYLYTFLYHGDIVWLTGVLSGFFIQLRWVTIFHACRLRFQAKIMKSQYYYVMHAWDFFSIYICIQKKNIYRCSCHIYTRTWSVVHCFLKGWTNKMMLISVLFHVIIQRYLNFPLNSVAAHTIYRELFVQWIYHFSLYKFSFYIALQSSATTHGISSNLL